MIVDGKAIQQEIKERLKKEIRGRNIPPRLSLLYVGEDPVIDTYIELKRRFGEEIGIQVDVDRYPQEIKEEELSEVIQSCGESDTDGIVLQLPLPQHIDIETTVNLITQEKDVDVLSGEAFKKSLIGKHPLPPVVGAIEEIFYRHGVQLRPDMNVVVIGKGRLVGKPVALWLLSKGISPVILQKGDDVADHTRSAGIIISGAGSPHLLTAEMVKEGVILIDAGTSDVAGETRGDIHPEAAEKAKLAALVPGGIGPITIAKLFENLITLS